MDSGKLSIIDGSVKITPVNGTVWLTKHEIADLFGCFVSKVGSNISVILKAGLLDESEVCRRKYYENGSFIEFYNLGMITAVAFRIRSHNADLFRRWLMKQAVQKQSDKWVSVFVPWSDKIFLN
ncbi:protein-tyrosine kinase [Dysgonomonas sp.]